MTYYKFCTNSGYGDVATLDIKLQQLGSKALIQNPSVNFQDIKNFMKGDADSTAAGTLKAMSLDDLRNYFQSENLSFDEL